MGNEKKEWKSTSGFDSLPLVNVKEKVGQETVGVFKGTRHFVDKDKQTQTVHKLEQDGKLVEFFGSGLLNWLLDPSNEKVNVGDEIMIVYKGLETPTKKAGKGNRHQFELFTR